jgi:hypothetical protein
VVVVVSTVVVRLVGRTGGSGVALEDVESAGQLAEPQARSVGQQPPPRLAGHERKPVEHVRGREAEAVMVTVLVTVENRGATGETVVVVVESDVEVVGVVLVEGDDTNGVIVV